MDKNAMENLYLEHFPRVYRTAYFVTGDHQMAEDVAQEAFLKAFANLHKLQERQKFASWISVIASNHAVDLLRKNKKVFFTDNMETYGGEDLSDNPTECWDKKETSQAVRDALARLEPEEREIIVLKYFNELSIKEIASLIKAPSGTIKSRLFRARDKIRLLLQPHYVEKRPTNKEDDLPLQF